LGDPSFADVGVVFTGTADPQPHRGNPIHLTAADLRISVGAAVLQAGVDQNPPLVHDGMQVPSSLKFVLGATNATPASHEYDASATQTVHVINGKAQPLTALIPLDATTWTPTSDQKDVRFFEQSMTITASVNILGGLTVIFDCKPNPQMLISPLIVHEGSAPPDTVPPTVTTLGSNGATTTTVAAAATTSTSGSLPRTGASWVLLLVLAAAAIDIGIVMIGATRRRFRHR
jgi:hypothetical protein